MSANISRTLNIHTKSAGLASRVIRFVGSDETLDRDGDVIAIEGWDISDYLKNPVVLYGHEPANLPIGKTVDLRIDQRTKSLVFDIYFPTIEELSTNPATPSDHALTVDAIYNLAKEGVLNAVSVGFQGLEYTNTDTGRNYLKQKLMEVSIVPIPSNPNALAILRLAGVAVTKGIFMEPKIEEKSGAKLSKETLAALEEHKAALLEAHKCFGNAVKGAIGKLDELMKSSVLPPDEDETPVETPSAPTKPEPKAAKADNIVFTLIEKDSTAKEEK